MIGSGSTGSTSGGHKGILEMAAEEIFSKVAETSDRDFLLRASFVEIYNENIRDLLTDSTDSSLNIREDPRRGVYCEATEVVRSSYDSIIRTIRKGKVH